MLHVGRAFLLLVLASLTCCSYGQKGRNPQSVLRNPHPTEVIEVSGVVASPLRVDRLRAIYRTHSSLPFCNGSTLPDGGPFPLHLNVDVPTVKTGEGVKAKIEADRYVSLCGWRLSDIYAVVRDGDRDRTQELIARALADEPRAQRPDGIRTDLTMNHCGYGADFWCPGNGIGNDDYWPVFTDADHRQVRFVIRLGRYPPPSNYRAPCRDSEGDTPYFPCRTKGD
jgi:hypothetical protein